MVQILKTGKRTWKIVFGYMDLDLTLRIEKSPYPMDSSTSKQRKLHEKWDRLNRMSLMIIERDILEVCRGIVSDDITSAKEFFAEIEKRFAKKVMRRKQVLFFGT